MAKNTDRRDPVYTVGRVGRDAGGALAVIEVVTEEVEAKTQEKACDAVVGGLPVEQRNGEFGAFLANSLKTIEYEAEQTVAMRKKRRQGYDPDLVSAAPPESLGPED